MGETAEHETVDKKPAEGKEEVKDTRPFQEKEFSDDTDSHGTDDSGIPEVQARRSKRHRRHMYKDFIVEHAKFWMTFNGLVAFFSVGFLVGTYLIISHSETDCGSLKLVLYMVIALWACNLLMSSINLCKLEVKVCN